MSRNTTISEAVREEATAAGFTIAIEPVSRQRGENRSDVRPIGDAPILTAVDLDKVQAFGMTPLRFLNGGQSFRVAQQEVMRHGIEKGLSNDDIVRAELNTARKITARAVLTVEKRIYLGPNGEEFTTKDEALEAWQQA
ncbi:MAG: hypothetical protein A2Z21_01745 [Candidatus Fraserbacteria bacterium RBG_16_55_9]|uniref:Uncharacterized protein n=1 Tax=Fraserbacteria sp. (strain RBG_16_55_9) TaxID=1817864 RepID=A0A1F5UR18_FRAXR|nr:MAG: hypothetical protein A2Z21_01745 [Candidatus Fraserbacteria bacterium RBG_16_55_9]